MSIQQNLQSSDDDDDDGPRTPAQGQPSSNQVGDHAELTLEMFTPARTKAETAEKFTALEEYFTANKLMTKERENIIRTGQSAKKVATQKEALDRLLTTFMTEQKDKQVKDMEIGFFLSPPAKTYAQRLIDEGLLAEKPAVAPPEPHAPQLAIDLSQFTFDTSTKDKADAQFRKIKASLMQYGLLTAERKRVIDLGLRSGSTLQNKAKHMKSLKESLEEVK